MVRLGLPVIYKRFAIIGKFKEIYQATYEKTHQVNLLGITNSFKI